MALKGINRGVGAGGRGEDLDLELFLFKCELQLFDNQRKDFC